MTDDRNKSSYTWCSICGIEGHRESIHYDGTSVPVAGEEPYRVIEPIVHYGSTPPDAPYTKPNVFDEGSEAPEVYRESMSEQVAHGLALAQEMLSLLEPGSTDVGNIALCSIAISAKKIAGLLQRIEDEFSRRLDDGV